jgi:hypothetical protein
MPLEPIPLVSTAKELGKAQMRLPETRGRMLHVVVPESATREGEQLMVLVESGVAVEVI